MRILKPHEIENRRRNLAKEATQLRQEQEELGYRTARKWEIQELEYREENLARILSYGVVIP